MANHLFPCRACSILFAFSSSRLREAGKPLPARFMKYCIMRMPELIPLGLTFFEAMCRAIVSASLVNMPFLGKVDSVVTLLTHRLLPLLLFRAGIPTTSDKKCNMNRIKLCVYSRIRSLLLVLTGRHVLYK